MSHNPDAYYSCTEVSNSDLTALKNLLHPVPMPPGVKERAFRFGTLVDAIITEPGRVNYYQLTVDDEQYTDDEFRHAKEMYRSLRMTARHDQFLAKVLEEAETQRFMVNKAQEFEYGSFPFTLDTRCKWDWWLGSFGGDLKTTAKPARPQHKRSLTMLSTSSIGIEAVPGTWTSHTATAISSMPSAKRTAMCSPRAYAVTTRCISVVVISILN